MFQKRCRFKDVLEETMTAPTITSYDHFLHDLKARIRAARTRAEFPDMKGFSPRSLKYMRKFAESWNDEELYPAE